jgi:hypothetical protein
LLAEPWKSYRREEGQNHYEIRFHLILGERFGSGDGERKTLLTRQIAFEPLPASVLFVLVGRWWLLIGEWVVCQVVGHVLL